MRLAACALLVVTAVADTAHGAQSVLGEKGLAALRACGLQRAASARLACYDAAAERYLSFDFAGTGRERTPAFDSAAGFRLGFHNEDVIFVIYVFDADSGELVKSYSAGPGEGEVAVRRHGRFYIEVKATGAWKIWIRPLAEPDTQAQQGKTKP